MNIWFQFFPSLLKFFLIFTLIQAFRYFLLAGGTTLALLKTNENWLKHRRIQKTPLLKKDLLREMYYSIGTFFIFGGILSFIFHPAIIKHTQLYFEWGEKGYPWLIFSFLFLFLFHDTYFYWMHRLVHHPKLFNLIHRVHHLSTNPSPLAAQAFHPLEALLPPSADRN